MTIDLSTTNEKQKLFFEAKSRFIAYGGARGGGKSWAVRKKATLMALRYSGVKMLLLRRAFTELQDNHILPLMSELKGIAIYKDSEKSFIFPNGSRLKFGYCDSERDVLQYQGQEYDVIFIDEATQFTEFQYQILTPCLRGANDFPKRMYLTCNPGGVGHEWVKRLFIDKEYRNKEKPEDYTFVQALVYDNKALIDHDTGYVDMLENLPEDIRRAWLLGDWDALAGKYFKEFKRDVHVCTPFAIPAHWKRYMTMDYGLDMLACYLIAVDEQGRGYVYHEIHEPNLIISDAAQKIREACNGQQIYMYLAPPDLWNRRQDTGKSLAETFREYGIDLAKTSNDRVSGWMAVHEWLKIGKDEKGEPAAKLKIFDTCPKLIKHLPSLQHDPKDVNDVANEPHDITHAPDALRGFCVYHTGISKAPEKPRTYVWEHEKPKPEFDHEQIKVI